MLNDRLNFDRSLKPTNWKAKWRLTETAATFIILELLEGDKT